MSYILFGEFQSCNVNEFVIKEIKQYAVKEDVYFLFNEEIAYDDDIRKMLSGHNAFKNDGIFFITTYCQPYNSDELLDPEDKYKQDELFPNQDTDDRTTFNRLYKEHFDRFVRVFKHFLILFKPQRIRVFVTEDYDTGFKVKKCSFEEMIDDIFRQIIGIGLDSIIYDLKV